MGRSCKVEYKQINNDLRNYKVKFDLIKNQLNFNPQFSVSDGLIEMKNIFKSNVLTRVDNPQYSNIKSIKENKNHHEH